MTAGPKPPSAPDAPRGPLLWRSLEELAGVPAPCAADPSLPGAVDRRTLLRLMATSLAAGGLAACGETDDPRAAPLLSRPRNLSGTAPGQSLFFATSLELDGVGRGVLVETRDGRPIKIEGNPLHPASLGATDVFAQAEILSLYDPDRSRTPLAHGEARGWADLLALLAPERQALLARGGRGLRILAEPVASPTLAALAASVEALLPEAGWHRYGPLLDDTARQGAIRAFGRPVDVVLDLTQADALLCLGGDLFLEAPGHIRYAADFAARKRAAEAEGGRPRLVVAETTPGITGAGADRRVILRPAEFEPFARAVLAGLRGEGLPTDGTVHPAAAAVAADLRRAGPRGVVAVGREQPAAVHALGHALNAALGAVGRTVRLIEPVVLAPTGRVESLVALAEAIAADEVSHLLILGGNPAYDAPADLGFAALLRRVPMSLHLGTTANETAAACRWHVPRRHPLESWGDLRAFDGTAGLCQPATEPLVEALGIEEALALLIGLEPDGRGLVRSTWRARWADFEERWPAALETGIVPGSAFRPLAVSLRDDWDAAGPSAGTAASPEPGTVTVTFTADPSVWDGRYANNGWLQEAPRPLTKLVWGNAALIAPTTAASLGLDTGDVVELRAGGRALLAPLWVMPGQAPDTVTLPLGYGRRAAGRLGNGIGFDAYALRPSGQPWTLDGVRIAATAFRQDLISTQGQHRLEGRDRIIRTVSADDPAARDAADLPLPSFYPEDRYPGHAWGMAIDLDACTGCNACVVACQVENNVPVVGPEEAARARAMHWLRIDRYYAGDPAAPETYLQPVLCMHCEKAPCEVVCPVNATVHSSEGLNDMVYNRCIGTRTCSNNCPYKVRRFNWFDYTPGGDDAATVVPSNPDVTIRSRGVMEKCTYCVQRIRAGTIQAELEGRRVEDGEIQTACQQACPTRAIVFGDINDPAATVTRLKASPRNYALLGELNTQPRTTYLARVVPTAADGSGGE